MLSVESITKQFDRNRPPAVDDLSFSVEKGRICGLLGHNGAGKVPRSALSWVWFIPTRVG